MVSAYVLVACEEGKAPGVVDDARRLGTVTDVDAVFGPYDLVMRVDAADVHQIARTVVSDIQSIPGVVRTDTCALF